MFTSLNLFDKYNDDKMPSCPIYCGVEHVHKGEDMNNRMEYDKGDVYDIFEEKSKSFDNVMTSLNEQGIGEDFILSLVMGSAGGGGSSLKGIKGLLKGLMGKMKSKAKFPHAYGDLSKNIKPYGGGLSESEKALLGNYRLQRKLSEMEYVNPSRTSITKELPVDIINKLKAGEVFRKTGVATGKATPNDPMFEALKKIDSQGEKIPLKRTIDFLLDK
jgi:hypothetical protein